jgi:hypothetical protein
MTMMAAEPEAAKETIHAGAASFWTEDRRFLFDLKRWACIPGVLTEDEIAACKEHTIWISLPISRCF